MAFTEYHRPSSTDEAMSLLRRATPHTAVLAGGTWLNGETPRDVEAVIDISALGLDAIQSEDAPPLLRIGAAVTLQRLVETFSPDPTLRAASSRTGSPDPTPLADYCATPGLAVLSVAAHAMAALNIRNRASLGGALVTADSSSPLVTALLACDAVLLIRTDEERMVSLSAFLSYREQIMKQSALITQFMLPVPRADVHSAYDRVARTPKDYPIVCAVARCAVKDGIAGTVRLAVGGAAAVPIRLHALENALEKKNVASYLDGAIDDALRTLRAPDNWLGSAEYRLAMARVLSRRVIRRAAGI